MSYFVIGVSGVTCSGKTSLTKLIQKKFPWAQVIHQDHYFHDDDWPHHIRCPEAENHVQYETFHALDMDKMYKDVQVIFDAPPVFRKPKPPIQNGTSSSQLNGDRAEVPNYDDSFVKQVSDIDVDVSKYASIPVLIIEGFTVFGSDYLYDKCDARFFCSLEKETCRTRRVLRNYNPPDTPSYFEKVVWPEYEKHFEQFIHQRSGVTVFDGSTLMETIWKESIQIIMCRMEEKYFLQEEKKEKKNSDASL